MAKVTQAGFLKAGKVVEMTNIELSKKIHHRKKILLKQVKQQKDVI